MNREALMDKLEEIQDRNNKTFLGSNESELHQREDIANLFESQTKELKAEIERLKSENINRFIDICGNTIDLKKVDRVGNLEGDSEWLRYNIYFTGGNQMEIFHKRKYIQNREIIQMDREEFIKIWESVTIQPPINHV